MCSFLAETCIKASAIDLEPVVRLFDVALVDLTKKCVECGAVIEVDKVRDLVRNDRTANSIRCLYQPPVDADAFCACGPAI